jgi:molybdopterin-guanine dinucleotide biosynthesis protein A
MIIDAIVLAGGRSARLGGTPKAALVYSEQTLLERTVGALSDARHVVVVGDIALEPGVPVIRESPAFAGPAAAIAAGVEFLGTMDAVDSDFTAVLACDMPRVVLVVPTLFDEATGDGVIAVGPDGRPQQLAAVYSTALLREATNSHRDSGDLENLSVRALLATLHPIQIEVAADTIDDVDTWDDAERLCIEVPTHSTHSTKE